MSDEPENDAESPPEEEDQVDRILRMQKEIEALGGSFSVEESALSLDAQEAFLKHVLDFEKGENESTLLQALVEGGVKVVPPDELGDEELSAKLRELIEALALLGTYLYHTDHLSDRELYRELWEEQLPEPAYLQPGNPNASYNIDFVGSGSEEDMTLYMKYYADDDERENWANDWDDFEMPEREKPPYDRDRHLPKWNPHGMTWEEEEPS